MKNLDTSKMDRVNISTFKATCLKLLQRVKQTGRPLLVTRRGEPIAQVNPPPLGKKKSWLGCMKGTAEILGDIIEPAGDEDDWEVLSL